MMEYTNYGKNHSFQDVQDKINRRYAEQLQSHMELVNNGGVKDHREWPEKPVDGKRKRLYNYRRGM